MRRNLVLAMCGLLVAGLAGADPVSQQQTVEKAAQLTAAGAAAQTVPPGDTYCRLCPILEAGTDWLFYYEYHEAGSYCISPLANCAIDPITAPWPCYCGETESCCTTISQLQKDNRKTFGGLPELVEADFDPVKGTAKLKMPNKLGAKVKGKGKTLQFPTTAGAKYALAFSMSVHKKGDPHDNGSPIIAYELKTPPAKSDLVVTDPACVKPLPGGHAYQVQYGRASILVLTK